MRHRKAKSLGETAGAQFELIRRLHGTDSDRRREWLGLNRPPPWRTRIRHWLRAAFGW